MSLALGVDPASNDRTARLTAAVGLLMSGSLALVAIEQFRDEAAGARAGLGLLCAVACAAWCAVLCRRACASRKPLLRIGADGAPWLVSREGGEPVAAALVLAWQLGGLVCLRLRPVGGEIAAGAGSESSPAAAAGADASAIGSGDCLLLLLRGSFDESGWHGLRRWLVWHRRSRRRELVTT